MPIPSGTNEATLDSMQVFGKYAKAASRLLAAVTGNSGIHQRCAYINGGGIWLDDRQRLCSFDEFRSELGPSLRQCS
jgi:hypothetical protein